MGRATTKELAEAVYELTRDVQGQALSDRVAAYLVSQKRSKELNALSRQLEELRLERDNVVEVKIESAFPLNDAIRAQIAERLRPEFGAAQPALIYHESINTNLIGGVRVLALGRQLDITLKHTLDALRHQITA